MYINQIFILHFVMTPLCKYTFYELDGAPMILFILKLHLVLIVVVVIVIVVVVMYKFRRGMILMKLPWMISLTDITYENQAHMCLVFKC